MASKEHDQPALAVNVAIGQSVAQSGNKTIQTVTRSLSRHQQKPRSVTVPCFAGRLRKKPKIGDV